VPVRTVVFGALIVLEQPPRPAAMIAKIEAHTKTDAILLKRKRLTTYSIRNVKEAHLFCCTKTFFFFVVFLAHGERQTGR
jgi:hypothetical protein